MERCKQVASECEFETFTVKDALLLNLCQYTPIGKLRNEILVKELKFEEAVKFGTTLEMASKESISQQREQPASMEADIQVLKKPGPYSKRYKQLKQRSESTTDHVIKYCDRCGRQEPHQCRAIEAKCYKCDKKGHFASKCRSKQIRKLEEVRESSDEESTEEY